MQNQTNEIPPQPPQLPYHDNLMSPVKGGYNKYKNMQPASQASHLLISTEESPISSARHLPPTIPTLQQQKSPGFSSAAVIKKKLFCSPLDKQRGNSLGRSNENLRTTI
jgi:hypothetical protein